MNGADGAQVGSGQVSGNGVPGGEVGESDGGREGGGDDGVIELIRSQDVVECGSGRLRCKIRDLQCRS